MYAILARMNAYRVISTLVGADIITIEEGDEVATWTEVGVTTCCPGHMNLIEKEAPRLKKKYGVDISERASTCHSPQEAVGAYMHHEQQKPEHAGYRHVNVSVMPCAAKSGEARRFNNQNVDLVIPTTQFIKLIEILGIDVHALVRMQKEGKLPALDTYPLAIPNSGGAVIFARSGGVTEAVLRYLGHKILGRSLTPSDLQTIIRKEIEPGIVLTKLTLGEVTLKALVVRGGKAAIRAYEMVANGEAKAMGVVVVEVMICPQGCITGGAQPCDEKLEALALKQQTLQAQDRTAPTFDPIGLEALEAMLAELGPEQRHRMFHRHETAH
jgi:iron only hydrogenase large subunit-like protein